MTIDVVIGNPPYSSDRNELYIKFAMLANTITSKFSSFIIPANWMTQYPNGSVHSDVDNFRLMTRQFSELHDFVSAAACFKDSINIPGRICFYCWNKDKVDNKTKHYIYRSLTDYDVINEQLYNEEFGVVIKDSTAIKIIEAIKEKDGQVYENFSILVGAKSHFNNGKAGGNMNSNWKEYKYTPDEEHSIKYYVNPRTNKKMLYENEDGTRVYGTDAVQFGYVSYNQIDKNKEDYKRPKLLVGQAHTAGDAYVIDNPFYAGNNSCCSQSYIPIFCDSDTINELNSILNYMRTKFFRFLVSILKSDQNLGNTVYQLVPMQDFTNNSDINWSKSVQDIDKQLFSKYNLSDNEIDYINSTIEYFK